MKDYNHSHYNDRVHADTAAWLLDLNRHFYEEHGRDFSATRLRLQLGVKRVIERLRGSESILDLGCGNAEVARSLSRRGHRGAYLGLDRSAVLLAEAGSSSFSFPVHFIKADLSQAAWDQAIRAEVEGEASLPAVPFDAVFCFAVLHHMPGADLRANIVCKIRELLGADGIFLLSNWRFTHSPRMRRRIQTWGAVELGLEDVDPNDYLLDWRSGGAALRYVHEFDEAELANLASANGFEIEESFYSDGADRQSSIYQLWRKNRG